ncbi:DUF1838 family protein [Novosphingobium piscinae]|uniref:DUF1838 family protein n=1 Tax=Novosphingobium piscinae TaxID=1507448 RepID=A0A7X1FZI8_9SPHN|nr:DUF1838 family protein [Novosphingobium piscinae]MBC2669875.1 DUF1838 family protein [Novosphingobium piscinae]
MPNPISRRTVIAGTPALAGAALLAAPAAAGTRRLNRDLADPANRARVRARIIGSCHAETTFAFFRLNIYGFTGDGNLIPFFTLNNLQIGQWSPLPDGTYANRTLESGVYCRFDTDEPLDTWDNPLTGERRKVWHFRGGPFSVTIGPDGVVTRGADLAPKTLRMEELGGMVFVPTAASAAFPNPANPETWPKLSSGRTIFWESHATYAAKAEDAFNEDLGSAPAFLQFQNLASWQPWMAMAGRPGRTWGKAHGAKLATLDQLPAAARKSFEAKTPDIFEWRNWSKPHNDIMDYLATQTPPG